MKQTETVLLSQTISQVQGNIASDMGGEKVMLSIKNGKYYNLGEVGGDIWDLMKEPIKIEKIVHSLLSMYDVDQSTCEEQVLIFLSKLNSEGLILIKD